MLYQSCYCVQLFGDDSDFKDHLKHAQHVKNV